MSSLLLFPMLQAHITYLFFLSTTENYTPYKWNFETKLTQEDMD